MADLTQPTLGTERIQALDFLRGFAILGILIMNIQSFAMPGAAYLNPLAYGDMTGTNRWVWILSHLFADQKFMTIFSILYGAGIVLVTERAEHKTGRSKGLHYRRNFWLLVIGLVHAHLIWYGDILVAYSLCALFAYWMRKKRPATLIIIGVLMISVHSLFYIMMGISMENWPPDSASGARDSWIPSQELIQEEIAAVTGTLGEQIRHNSASATFMETYVFLTIFLWRAGGLILIGMALYKLGVLTAARSNQFYLRGWILGWLLGFPVVIYGLVKNFLVDFAFEYSMFLGSQFNYWGSIGVSFGYICAIMLLARSSILPSLQGRLAAVGQMALTNYITQSIIGILIFHGVGLGLYGQVERTYQFAIVLAIWALQIVWSSPWLSNHRFGPLEWGWRSLTYRKRQPWKKTN